MSLSYQEQSSERRRLDALTFELEKLMIDVKEAGLDWTALYTIIRPKTSKLEWMILESLYKNIPIANLDKTLLLLPSKFIELLQNLTVQLQKVIHTKTHHLPPKK